MKPRRSAKRTVTSTMAPPSSAWCGVGQQRGRHAGDMYWRNSAVDLVVEPGVLQRDRELAGERAQQRPVALGELAAGPHELEHPGGVALDGERQHEHRTAGPTAPRRARLGHGALRRASRSTRHAGRLAGEVETALARGGRAAGGRRRTRRRRAPRPAPTAPPRSDRRCASWPDATSAPSRRICSRSCTSASAACSSTAAWPSVNPKRPARPAAQPGRRLCGRRRCRSDRADERLQRGAVLLPHVLQALLERDRREESRHRALPPVLHVGAVGDEAEGDRHQQVPLPPRRRPVPRERHGDHRLGQQEEGGDDAEQHHRRAAPVQHVVPRRGDEVEHEPRDGQRRRAGRARLRRASAVERRQAEERDGPPADEQQGDADPQRPCRAHEPPPGAGRQSTDDAAANAAARTGPTGVAMTKPALGAWTDHAGRGEGVEREEAGAAPGTPARPGRAGRRRARRASSLMRTPSTG